MAPRYRERATVPTSAAAGKHAGRAEPVKDLLDTNVYLDASRSAARRDQFRTTFFPLLPATYLSAVVAYELMVDAADRRTRTHVEDFIRPLERTGRLVTPTFGDWVEGS